MDTILKFLRKTNWARVKIEELYIDFIDQEKKEM
ncbi:MAG: DNA-binding protein VF530 [Chlorobiaceae bacterium]|nr:DNA-binding protein VF530 [Chlorobiaceae bacterium]